MRKIEFKDYSHVAKHLKQCFGLLTNRKVYIWVRKWDGETNRLGLDTEEWVDFDTLTHLIYLYYCTGFKKAEKKEKMTRDKYCFDLVFTRDEPKSRIIICLDFDNIQEGENKCLTN